MSDNNSNGSSKFTIFLKRLIIFGIPVVNVIAALLWAYTGRDEETRGFGRAALLVIILFAVITLISGLLAFTFLSSRLFEILP